MGYLHILLITAAALTIFSCDSSTDSDDSPNETGLFLRVKNNTDNTITVSIEPGDSINDDVGITANFGSVNVGQTTDYKKVNNQFKLFVNGAPFERAGEGDFGIDDQPSRYWTLTINSLNGGWELVADL